MLESDLPEFIVAGDRGHDLFRRIADEGQRRVRFECLASWQAGDAVPDGQWQIFAPAPGLRARAEAALERFRANPALQADFALGDATRYPAPRNPAQRLAVLQYLEFLRARLVAEIAVGLFEDKLARDAALAVRDHAETASTLKLLVDFNLLSRAGPLLPPLSERLCRRVAAPGFVEDTDQLTGFALRLLGDLHLRRDAPSAALACFDAAIRAGDSPFRRRKAIEAARAAGDRDAARRHLDAHARNWALPADLAALRPWADAVQPTSSERPADD
ncbi:MAG: hypothetical protein ACK4LQ_01660 [Pararhodobacter sp.]